VTKRTSGAPGTSAELDDAAQVTAPRHATAAGTPPGCHRAGEGLSRGDAAEAEAAASSPRRAAASSAPGIGARDFCALRVATHCAESSLSWCGSESGSAANGRASRTANTVDECSAAEERVATSGACPPEQAVGRFQQRTALDPDRHCSKHRVVASRARDPRATGRQRRGVGVFHDEAPGRHRYRHLAPGGAP
jgi:hypothetical protein